MGKRIYLGLPKPGLINGVILTTKKRGGVRFWVYQRDTMGYIMDGYIYIYIHILAPPQNRERDLKKGRVKMSTVGKI